MTAFPSWEIPILIPPGMGRAKDGRRVRIVTNPAVPVPSVISTPLLDAEAHTWVKPPASVCFPMHPLGALALYHRARQLLLDTGLSAAFLPEQLDIAEAHIWRFAVKLYKAGESIRSCLDFAVDNRHFQLREEDARDPFVAQPAQLAAWLVVRAAVGWAKEADA